MKPFASMAAIILVALGVTLAVGRTAAPPHGFDYGLTGNDWWAAHVALDKTIPFAR